MHSIYHEIRESLLTGWQLLSVHAILKLINIVKKYKRKCYPFVRWGCHLRDILFLEEWESWSTDAAAMKIINNAVCCCVDNYDVIIVLIANRRVWERGDKSTLFWKRTRVTCVTLFQDSERRIRLNFTRQNTAVFNHPFVNILASKRLINQVNFKCFLIKIT